MRGPIVFQLMMSRCSGNERGRFGKNRLGGLALLRQIAFKALPPHATGDREILDRVAVLRIQRGDVHRGLREERRPDTA